MKDLFKSLGATVYAHYYRPSRIPKSVPKPRKILKCQKGHKATGLAYMVQTELMSIPQVALLSSIKPINAEQTGRARVC